MHPNASLTVREAIRIRPLGIGVLEDAAGASFWNRLDLTLREFCQEAAVDADALLHRFATLPENIEGQDWAELPLYFLADHLTAEHRAFRSRDLPDVHRLLEGLRLEFPAGHAAIESLLGDFKGFRQEFTWHMQEEEEFLFPKILRTEASLRHPDLYPETYKGSIAMFPAHQLHAPESLFHQLLAGLFVRLRDLASDPLSRVAAVQALDTLHGYEARLKAHTYLESEVLFPRALAMEATILRRTG